MANIQERRNKDGKLISYSIRVYKGMGADGKQLKPWTTTFEVKPTWSEKSARKKAEAFAAVFEKECKEGVTTDSRQKFAAYCDYVIGLKENRGGKHRTATRYRELTERIYPAIGHIKLRALRVDHLNDFYTELGKEGVRKGRKSATAKIDLVALRKEKEVNYFQLEEVEKIQNALEDEPIKWRTLIHMLLITGARRGEVLGLKWDKVDFEGSKIRICNNILY